jgi:hypothetical protein
MPDRQRPVAMPEQPGATQDRARPRVFQFAYLVTPHNLRRAKAVILWNRELHYIRDASAFVELYETIIGAGWTMGETILNLPKDIPRFAREVVQTARVEAAAVDDTSVVTEDLELSESDLIVVTTRVPLDDEEEAGYKIIPRSYTPRESIVFSTVRQCFLKRCSRKRISLAKPLRDFRIGLKLDKGIFHFSYRSAATFRGKKNMAFLLYAPHLLDPDKKKPPGPKLLVSFSPAGVENWLWARALRRLHPDLLSQIITSDKYWCVIGTWDPKAAPIPPRPRTLTFADRVQPDLEVAWSKAPYEEDAVWERLLPWSQIPGASPNHGAWQVPPTP